MVAADTNVLVRLIAHDDEHQLAIAEAFVARGVWVSHIVLAETLWVLGSDYEFDARDLVAAVQMLLDNNLIVWQDADVVEAALALYRRTPSLGFSDCLILETARKAGHLPLGTFDRALGKCDGAERL